MEGEREREMAEGDGRGTRWKRVREGTEVVERERGGVEMERQGEPGAESPSPFVC